MDINHYSYSLDEFKKLSDEEAEPLIDKAFKLNWPHASRYFNDYPEIDWVVISGNPPKIVRSGEFDNEPLSSDLKQIEKELNALVFCYSRPIGGHGPMVESFIRILGVSVLDESVRINCYLKDVGPFFCNIDSRNAGESLIGSLLKGKIDSKEDCEILIERLKESMDNIWDENGKLNKEGT